MFCGLTLPALGQKRELEQERECDSQELAWLYRALVFLGAGLALTGILLNISHFTELQHQIKPLCL